ncbi:hypothetical protein F3J44_17425 [Pantoea sp. Tr-811]|uniref:delta-60 repeat domain-containing protein n=1 Tax=Pantoea sp. Tr-811 TaxID=2608361 RepID=UPI001423F867|nr:delta-60 repeat domain-containing protein [Pantoea sp. Tr-811]NIF28152.1 hypothetical protein [Pantoea sp. Tr-811]
MIVVCKGATPKISIPEATSLYGYDMDGHQDLRFRRIVRLPVGNLSLHHASFDDQGRLVLAGERYYEAESADQIHSELYVVRLLADGTLDDSFGNSGFTQPNAYLWAATDLNVNANGIRVFTLMPMIANGPQYEMIACFQP